MTDKVYSALRESLLSEFNDKPVIPIDFTKKGVTDEVTKQANTLGLDATLFILTLPISDSIKLDEILEKLREDHPERKVDYALNGNVDAIGWIVSKGVVDSQGLPIFSEVDVAVFNRKYIELILFLVWQVMDVNGFTTKAKTELVGNSEETV